MIHPIPKRWENVPLVEAKTEVFPGWHALLDDLYAALERLPYTVRVAQVKEKFGQLRVYVHPATAIDDDTRRELYELLGAFETRSAEICEFCGAPGRLDNSTGWLKTACPAHSGREARDAFLKAHRTF